MAPHSSLFPGALHGQRSLTAKHALGFSVLELSFSWERASFIDIIINIMKLNCEQSLLRKT